MSEFDLIILPDADEAEAAEVYVAGRLAGQPYRFLLDTGAARTSLIWDDYTSTFPSAEKHDSSGVFAAHSSDLITVPSIEFGTISRQNVTVTRDAADAIGVRSLIGMDLLKEYRLRFFFDGQRVSVDADGFDTSIPLQPITMDSRFHPYVAAQFGDTIGNAVWDTGASITVADMSFIQKHAAYFQEAGESTGIDSTGAEMDTPMFLMSQAVIGGCTFPAHKVAAVDLSQVNASIEIPMDLILGYSTLRKANWWFDFPRRQWAISKWLNG